jgi:dTDP-4-dehydrorhamnose 3,5-epimerase
VRVTPLAVPGPALVAMDELRDERGFFARSFCVKEFADAGLEPVVAQCNVSYNHTAGTLRGLHYQTAEAPEAKLVRCTRGAILDVVVDMRASSPTLGRHVAVELTEDNHLALYVPPLFAHAYLTLQDATEVHYQVSQPYTPNSERGLRFDDPVLEIEWPLDVQVISDKDRNWPLVGSIEALAAMANDHHAPDHHGGTR